MTKRLKIGYFADGIWAHNAFLKIIEDDNFEIAFIVPRFDTRDQILKEFATKYNIPFIISENINSPEFLNKIKKFNCDIFVSMSFNQIFRSEIINLPKFKTINCHAGKLPKYRGRNILNWVLINDEKEFGISVHYIDEGIDTGDIILQKTFGISDNDDYASLLSLAHKECANLLFEALCQIQNNTAKRMPQQGVGFYCSQRSSGDEFINWDQNSREIFNFIRSITPPAIGAKSFIKDKIIQINKSSLLKNAPFYKCKNGAVVGLQDDGFIVKTNDSIIKISDYIYDGKIKIGNVLTSKIFMGGGYNALKNQPLLFLKEVV
ncbi:methionyl-tRNA formyltransferase [Campylobacter hyointestinalis]|uniref:methionyl-tRNA formyltransferase n=1 Tax=Campylobacter hyointestinalis TaxID=198 RepID=UPI0011ABA612|nr:methionyl-tRNA formyltransferase [Campylobacter hyointestinalis]TWO22529.1 methionyl-tRNA formyltransferase [Campylobacter hyointestinalis]